MILTDETLARRLSELDEAMQPIIKFLEDDSVLEIFLSPEGSIWVDEIGSGRRFSGVVMTPQDSERMIGLIAASLDIELNSRNPRLNTKLPHWGARVLAIMPPIVETPMFSLRKPSSKKWNG